MVFRPRSIYEGRCRKDGFVYTRENLRYMENDLTPHIRSAEKIQRRMASSPCEYIETAFEAERHALDASGASRDALRKAIQTTSASETWTDEQRAAFIAWVEFLEGKIEDR